MSAASSPRTYDLIVFGATGYTGKLTSEQVLLTAPDSLKWAIAGRSAQKLEAIAADYNRRFPDRVPVGMHLPPPHPFSPVLTGSIALFRNFPLGSERG